MYVIQDIVIMVSYLLLGSGILFDYNFYSQNPKIQNIDLYKSELIEFKVLDFEHIYMKNPDTGIYSYVLHLYTTAGVLFGFDNSNINIIRIGQKYVAGVKGKEIIQMFCGLGLDTSDTYKIERKIVSLDVCNQVKEKK